ncbi:hypothetical protein RIB2604_01704750 [Aspergillus luchuensis]|uniref:Short-chain dehydrogenase n=1 Tax=Aspergillus kawachii TaxID=1069201 RepID=A0A146FBS5_ASPKA|nr:hypothetical protein RIB2604_01704750 [Aspergillus luchuensis]
MPVSSLHILDFSFSNPYTLTLDPYGPFAVLYRLWFSRCGSVSEKDLSNYANKRVLITGGTSGCGLECTKAFARAGAHVIVTARNREKGEVLREKIMKETEPLHITPKFDVLELEMGSEDSITAFNARLQEYPSLDLVILNAGIYQTEFVVCENTGREQTLQELARRIDPARVLIASATPGFCRSGLFRSFNGKTIANYLERLLCRTPDQGAWQYLTAIERMNTAVHGCFFADGRFRP